MKLLARAPLITLLLLTASLSGCFLMFIGGAAGEAGYTAGQKESASAVIKDQWITTKIKTEFLADSTIKGRDIHVTTTNGAVTLRGTVLSQAEKARAEDLAHKTKGVKKVISYLMLSR